MLIIPALGRWRQNNLGVLGWPWQHEILFQSKKRNKPKPASSIGEFLSSMQDTRWCSFPPMLKPGLIVYTCNLRTREVEIEGSGVEGQPALSETFVDEVLGTVKTCFSINLDFVSFFLPPGGRHKLTPLIIFIL